MRRALAPVLLALCWAQAAPVKAAGWRFRWQAGQVLTYRVEQQTRAAETTREGTTQTTTAMSLVKRWRVLAVDAAGVATVQHSLDWLRIETATPSGEKLLFDSRTPDKSDPQMREQLGKYVGVPLATLRVDAVGRVVEVKESKFGPASRFEAELPFAVVLPDAAPKAGQAWQREYNITLEPPQGTGEKYAAVQKYTCKSAEGAGAVIALATEAKAQPEAVDDRIPLLKLQPEGEVVFDVAAGRVQGVRLKVDRELKNHQGEGSSYHFQSNYSEQFAGDK